MSIASLRCTGFQLVSFTCIIFATSLLIIVLPTVDASNSFTPINCYDCASSPSSTQPLINTVSITSDVDNSAIRKGQYLGSVMKAELDDNVVLHGDNDYSSQYQPQTSFPGTSGGYSDLNTNKFSVQMTSHETHHKSNDKEKFGHPTNFGNSGFNSVRGPFGGLGGVPFQGTGVRPFGGLGGRPFGGPQFGGQGSSFLGGGAVPGNQPFGVSPGGAGFGAPGVPLNSVTNPNTFSTSGNNAFAVQPLNGGFTGTGGGFPGQPLPPTFGGIPGSLPGGGFGVSPSLSGAFNVPGQLGVSGNQGSVFGPSNGLSVPGSINMGVSGPVSNPNGIPQILGQQFVGNMENGVGEVVQPAQTELKPEVIEGGMSDSSNDVSSQQLDYGSSGYFYGYPSSNYQQPLPDITEGPTLPPNPTSIIPVNKPEGVGGPVPVPLPPPPYGYYYIGRKAWYVPLYFCVYFIVYVGCLILKHMYRHKAHYPEKLHEAVIENSRKNNENVQQLTNFIITAFDKWNEY